jgi:CubicO group peptidase (beta-lactamase class C family)
VLSFRLDSPVTISTERGQAAFQPVTQDDYNSRASNARPQRFAAPVGPGYPPPPAYYEYPYAYGYPYAYPYYPVPLAFGFYGGYYGGWGRFGGFRR